MRRIDKVCCSTVASSLTLQRTMRENKKCVLSLNTLYNTEQHDLHTEENSWERWTSDGVFFVQSATCSGLPSSPL